MSLLSLMADADKAMAIKHWGTKIKENDTLKDTGVQEFVEELIRLLASQEPITLNRPLELRNMTNGPAIKIYNDGPLADWMGVRVQDRDGNQAQFGIGLGSEGITANSFVPHPKYSIDPNDQQRFYSDLGGNAGTDREHPKAVEAGNGLVGLEFLINNYQVPIWILNLMKQPKFQDDDCHARYRADWFGQAVYFPTYVPQSLLLRGVTNEDIDKGFTGDVTLTDDTILVDVSNPFYICVKSGDKVLIACVEEEYIIVSTEQHRLFDTGVTDECIEVGGSGSVTLSDGVATASSPFDMIESGVSIAVSRASVCDDWTITARACPDPGECPA